MILGGLPPDADPAATLDGLLRRGADAHPERLAIADDPRRGDWNLTPPQRLSYGEAERKVEALAAFFRLVGFKPDARLVLAAPATVDTVLTLLGALRAGLIVVAMPPTWRRREWLAELPPLAPEGIVTTGVVDGVRQGASLRDAGDAVPSVRFMFAFGGERPEGMLDLMRLAEVGRPAARAAAPDEAGAHIATATFAAPAGGGARLHARSHASWIAAGRTVVAAAGLGDGARLLMPFALSGLAGIGAGLVPWLLTGGTLLLHHARRLDDLLADAASEKPQAMLLPGPVAEAAALRLGRSEGAPPTLIALWKDRHPKAGAPLPGPLLDATSIDELAFVLQPRGEDGALLPLPSGAAGTGGAGLELRVEGALLKAGDRDRPLVGGAIALRGAMLPAAGPLPFAGGAAGIAAGADGFVRSAVACRLVEGRPPSLLPLGPFGDALLVAGLPVDGGALDALYAGAANGAEAAAFLAAGPVPVLKAAVVAPPGGVPDAASFRAALERQGVPTHLLPAGVVPVTAIPRSGKGAPLRTQLAERAASH